MFFHNGVVRDLADAVRFYAERDVRPERWYPVRSGSAAVYDDVPKQYRSNVNREPPFGGKPGHRPALTDAEIADVVAFLRTLTDGYASGSPPHGATSMSMPMPMTLPP